MLKIRKYEFYRRVLPKESCSCHIQSSRQRKFPTTESFSDSLLKVFGGGGVGGLIKEWARYEEPHENGGFHFHMVVSLNKSRRWGPVKKSFLSKHGESLHFQEDNCGYVAAYRYFCKGKPIAEVLHSPGHSNSFKNPENKKGNASLEQLFAGKSFPNCKQSSSRQEQ